MCLQLIYKSQSKQEMAKVTTTADAVEITRAKWAQTLTNQASLDTAFNYADLVLLFFKHLSLVVVVRLSSVPVQRPSC